MTVGAEDGFGSVKVTAEATASWSDSVANTMTNVEGGSKTSSCGSLACSSGRLYQWRTIGAVNKEWAASLGALTQSVDECSFACVSNLVPISTTTGEPLCPPQACGTTLPGTTDCQCCNSNAWAMAADQSQVNTCPSVKRSLRFRAAPAKIQKFLKTKLKAGAFCSGCD